MPHGVEPRPSVNDWSFARTKSMKQLGMPQKLDILMTQSAKALLGDLENCWDLDVLQLHEVTGGRPLFALFWAVVHKHGLLDHMKCSPQTFSKFVTKIEDGYLDNPYHNSTHAADVPNGCHHFGNSLALGYTNHAANLPLFISAAIHDFEHPGVSNTFLINTNSPLAVTQRQRCL